MESYLEESQRWMAKARSSLTAAKKLLEESLFAIEGLNKRGTREGRSCRLSRSVGGFVLPLVRIKSHLRQPHRCYCQTSRNLLYYT